ncbi:T9SS type A sorting domain-containing protein [Chryseobacterium populi]|uniref:Por secretion system C-terminal sorting domain containing protein n=1 Tax=Chryseobacterium populi TaxID=1144316 RepID=J3CKY5_9FLAO|nr:T9SS type A sorting domain-containing protein [Chryseobacterium populi]EJL73669.1 Por secretion system C-terminal sorting domain containing protein [Chryseobacterium populi]
MFKNLHFVMRNIGVGLGLLCVAGSYTYAQQWEDVGGVQTVSAGGSSNNNLIVDNAGNYFLSYYDVSVAKGSVQKFDGNSWSYVGGGTGITNSTALFNSLSLDNAGNIYYTNQIGYPGSGMEVRQFTGTGWAQLPNVTDTSVNYQASAVSPANVLFTYGSYDSGTVKRYVNGAWEQVGNAGFSGGAAFAEMVIGTNNKVYTCNVAGGVKVYENSTTAANTDNWTLVGGSIVDASSSGEQYTSDIAIDANNNLYVSYVSNTANGKKLNVKKFDGTSWIQVGNANFSPGVVQEVAIAVTATGEPYVVASRFENDNFRRNTVYRLDPSNQTWVSFGGDFISDGEATYNDLAIDKTNHYLVLAYSQNGTRVKRISIAGTSQICNNTDPGNNPGDIGCVSFVYKGQAVSYTTVRGADGKIWLQQNLGSSQVATAVNDQDSYGDLFQWGRWDDGHQTRTSPTTGLPATNSPDGLAGITSYIIGSSPAWWSPNSLTDLWEAGSAAAATSTNGADPCKAVGQGWKMPDQTDWEGLSAAENISNPATAYSSHLKLPAAGYRSSNTGGFTFVGERGYYWSSTTSSSGGKYFYIGTTIANPGSGGPRGQGESVRCIKDFTGLSTSNVQLNTVGIYPNPTNGILNIKTDSAIESVNIVNGAGQKIKVQFSGNQMNMQGLPNGIYIAELKLKNGQTVVKKVVKN